MKKYCLFIILTVLSLCGCEKEKPPEYVYHEHSPLTIVTTTTTAPADTYSEYMETYTPPSTTGTDVYYYHLSPEYSRSGNASHALSIDIPPMDKPQIDKSLLPGKAVRPSLYAETEAVTTAPVNEEAEETSTASPAFTIQLPETVAIHSQTVQKDTAPTEFVPATATEASTLPAE